MKSRHKRLLILCLCALGLSIGFGSLFSQQTAGELFEKALYIEEAQGDLQRAIGLYQDILKKFPDDRQVAAKAQLHVGICFEKLGLNQAQEAFQKVVENYPEQAEAVKLAREKLARLIKAQAAIETGDKELRIRNVSGLAFADMPWRVSPDGRYFSYYSDNEADEGNLYTYEISTGKSRRLTQVGESEYITASVWSPDGRQIVCGWEPGPPDCCDLRIVSLDGSKPRLLYHDDQTFALPADWSPDGKHILAVLRRPNKRFQVGLITVADGTVNLIEALDGKPFNIEGLGGYFNCVRFSPDGKYIAYSLPQKKDSSDFDIFVYSMGTKTVSSVVENPADDEFLDWTPDGKGVLFSSDRLRSPDIWLLPFEAGAPAGEPKLVKEDMEDIYPLGIASDGSFYYVQTSGTYNVYIASLDEERTKFLSSPERLAKRTQGNEHSPAWAPDGQSLAYVLRKGNAESPFSPERCIAVFSFGTSIEEEIVRFPAHGGIGWFGLTFSPDGRSILASRTSGWEGDSGVVFVDIQKKEMNALFAPEGNIYFPPAWSPDGKGFFFPETNWGDLAPQISFFETATRQKKEIYRQGDKQIYHIALSPDGTRVAFNSDGSGTGGTVIKIIPANGGNPKELSQAHPTWWSGLSWTNDGKELLYFVHKINPAGTVKGSELWKISVDGGVPSKIWETTEDIYTCSLHPDGRRLAFDTRRFENAVWVMENFLLKK